MKPLAEIMRPTSIDDVVGQKHLLGEGKILRKIIDEGRLPNMIFYGPPGIGKTTVARIIAQKCGKTFKYLNATTASISDIKDVASESANDSVVVYLDEIQYFNKKQQQVLLSYIESGDIILIAATTENPSFYVYQAILSRSMVFEFKPLIKQDIVSALRRTIDKLKENENVNVSISDSDLTKIAMAAAGDVRKSINLLDTIVMLANYDGNDIHVEEHHIKEATECVGSRYDKDGDRHYDIISAYQKSMRGSDPDAAVYYLGLLLAAGDLPSACRRLLVCANEDVGLAYPQIIPIVKAAVDTAMMVGLPEARLPLANAVILVSTSPKSNSAHNAIIEAMSDISRGRVYDIPRHLQNCHTDGENAEVYGQHYKYPHDYANHYVKQQYLPNELKDKKYYVPASTKTEQQAQTYWKKVKEG